MLGKNGGLLLDKFTLRIILSGVVFIGIGMLCLVNDQRDPHAAGALDHNGLSAPPSSTFPRPQSLTELNLKSESLRSYAAKVGLYFGSMQDSANKNWGMPWVQDLAGSEFNLMEPGNQLKWLIIHPAQNMSWTRLSEQFFRFDMWSSAGVRLPSGEAAA